MTLREILVSTLLLVAGIQAAANDQPYHLTSHQSHVQAKRQEGGAKEGGSNQGGSMVNVHVVKVGDDKGTLRFFPDDMKVPAGEMVQFQFHPRVSDAFSSKRWACCVLTLHQNHSLVQSTFDRPCEPMGRSQRGMAGIQSGFMPVEPGSRQMPVFTIMVNSTQPMWFYCSQGRHCQNGMVMAINAVAGSNRTIETFRSLAARAGNSTSGNGGNRGGQGNPTNNNGRPSSTSGRPAEQTRNAAPRTVAHVAGLSGLLLAVAAVVGL
ncbi:hypothetical protein PRK78_000053 [Emydomyces testavorans]|uniref:Extracellular serine-rich protein n=1 Tax=Emydomyces testavorans TaxID=2070801 RepID=A0AAF0DAF9_9EURO|nr:hypothetical protein PRK78_000053 [Emydomyces testavorans]